MASKWSQRWASAARNLLLLFIVLLVFLKRSATCLSLTQQPLATSTSTTSTPNVTSSDQANSSNSEMTNTNQTNPMITNEDQLKFPLYMRLLATVACLVIFTIGVCGNLLVPLVVIKTKYLRNSTNLFLINLSIADLLVLTVCMPTVLIELHSKPETWLLGEPMCKLSNFVEMFAANGSIFTILAISFERYYAICKPLKAGYKCTRLRATIIICLIWLLSTLLTSPILIMAKSSETIYIDGSLVYNCILETDTYWHKMYVFVSMFAFFCLPLLVLMLVYWLISRRLIRETIARGTGDELHHHYCCNNSSSLSSASAASNGKHLHQIRSNSSSTTTNNNNKSVIVSSECCCSSGADNKTIKRAPKRHQTDSPSKRTSISGLLSAFNHSQRNKNNNNNSCNQHSPNSNRLKQQTNKSIRLAGTDRPARLVALNKALSLDQWRLQPTYVHHASSSITTTDDNNNNNNDHHHHDKARRAPQANANGQSPQGAGSARPLPAAGQRTQAASLLGRLLKLVKLSTSLASSPPVASHSSSSLAASSSSDLDEEEDDSFSINGLESQARQSKWSHRFKFIGRAKWKQQPATRRTTPRVAKRKPAKYELVVVPEELKQVNGQVNGNASHPTGAARRMNLARLKRLDAQEADEEAAAAANDGPGGESFQSGQVAVVGGVQNGIQCESSDKRDKKSRADNQVESIKDDAKAHLAAASSGQLPADYYLLASAQTSPSQHKPLESRKRRRQQHHHQQQRPVDHHQRGAQQQTGSQAKQRAHSRPFRWYKGLSGSSTGAESSTYTNSTQLTSLVMLDSDERRPGADCWEGASPTRTAAIGWKHQYQLSSTSSGVDLSMSASIRARPKITAPPTSTTTTTNQQVVGFQLDETSGIKRPPPAGKKSAHFDGRGDQIDDDDENNNNNNNHHHHHNHRLSMRSGRQLIGRIGPDNQSRSCSRSSSIVLSRSSSESNLAPDATSSSFTKSNSSSSPDSMFHHEHRRAIVGPLNNNNNNNNHRLAPLGGPEPTSGRHSQIGESQNSNGCRFNPLKHDRDLLESDERNLEPGSDDRSGRCSRPFIKTDLNDHDDDDDDDENDNGRERSMASSSRADQGERAAPDESDEVFKRVKMICYVKGNVTNDKKLGRRSASSLESPASASSAASSSSSMADNEFQGRDNNDAKIKVSPSTDSNSQPNQIKLNPTEHWKQNSGCPAQNKRLAMAPAAPVKRQSLRQDSNQIDEDEAEDLDLAESTGPLKGAPRTETTTTTTVTTMATTKPPISQANKMNSLVSMAQLTFQQNQCKRLQKRSGSQPIVSSHYHHHLVNQANAHNHHHHHPHHLGAHPDFIVVRDISKKQQMDSRRQVVIMLAFVVACFFLLFFPYRVFTIWLILSTDDQVQSLGMETYYNLTYFSRILIYLHSAINPIAYNLISTKFRQAFMSILLCRGPATRRHFTTEHQRFLQNNNYYHHHHHHHQQQHITSSQVHKTGSNPATSTTGLSIKKKSPQPANHHHHHQQQQPPLTIVTK